MHANMNDLWFLFATVSNELKSPKVLADPGDTRRSIREASSWGNSFNGGLFHVAYQNNSVSYWLGAHATSANPLSVLSGDRNIATEGAASCSSQIRNLSNVSRQTIDWTNAVHGRAGSLVFMDGRVQEATSSDLKQITTPTVGINRNTHFLFPLN